METETVTVPDGTDPVQVAIDSLGAAPGGSSCFNPVRGWLTLGGYRIDDAGKEKEYFNTKLDNVKIVAVKPKMLDIKNPDYEKHNHLEDVELRYETITWSYKDGNIMHKDTWNERS